jgi:hypothetical protein
VHRSIPDESWALGGEMLKTNGLPDHVQKNGQLGSRPSRTRPDGFRARPAEARVLANHVYIALESLKGFVLSNRVGPDNGMDQVDCFREGQE